MVEYDLEYNERNKEYAIPILWITSILTIGMLLLTVVRY